MKRAMLVLASLALAAADTPPPKNGVIKPSTNVDPKMKVVPPPTATRTPVVHSPTGARHSDPLIIPK